MSTVKAKNVQIGNDSTTATNNLTIAVPSTQDGSLKVSRGNAGATTKDLIVITPTDSVQIPQLDTPYFQGALPAVGVGTYSNTVQTITKEYSNRWTLASDGSKITAQQAGMYEVWVSQLMQANSQFYLHIRKNGTLIKHAYNSGQTYPVDMQMSVIVPMAVGDYIDIFANGTFQQAWSGPHSSFAVTYLSSYLG